MQRDDDSGTPNFSSKGRMYVLRVGRDDCVSYQRQVHQLRVREGPNGMRRLFENMDDCIEHVYGERIRF